MLYLFRPLLLYLLSLKNEKHSDHNLWFNSEHTHSNMEYISGGTGGGGCISGVYRPALLIFTLFQSNIYKVNVREYPPGIYVVKMNTVNC